MNHEKLLTVLDEITRRKSCQGDRSLARLLGVAPSTVSHYRSGSRRPSLDRIEEMAHLLGADPYDVVDYLRDGRADH